MRRLLLIIATLFVPAYLLAATCTPISIPDGGFESGLNQAWSLYYTGPEYVDYYHIESLAQRVTSTEMTGSHFIFVQSGSASVCTYWDGDFCMGDAMIDSVGGISLTLPISSFYGKGGSISFDAKVISPAPAGKLRVYTTTTTSIGTVVSSATLTEIPATTTWSRTITVPWRAGFMSGFSPGKTFQDISDVHLYVEISSGQIFLDYVQAYIDNFR